MRYDAFLFRPAKDLVLKAGLALIDASAIWLEVSNRPASRNRLLTTVSLAANFGYGANTDGRQRPDGISTVDTLGTRPGGPHRPCPA